jgi:hypothetical protein
MVMYLKKKDGQEYGPVHVDVMKRWAAQGRVEPSDVVSEDRDAWKPAPEYTELGMEWVVDLPDGQEYGPVHALALANLLKEELLRPESHIRRKGRDDQAVTSEVLLNAVIDGHPDLETWQEGERVADPSVRQVAEPGAAKTACAGQEALEQVNAALTAEVSRWRGMYETARDEALRREDLLVGRLDTTADAGGGVSEAELRDLGPRELQQRCYAARKEANKWRVMYDQERADARAREDHLHQRLEEFCRSESETRAILSATTRRLAALEANYAALMQAAESGNGRNGVGPAAQFGGMLQAYTDLSQSYDHLQIQLEQREAELAEVQQARAELERVADERFTELEAMVCREQENAREARRQLAVLQTAHRQLVRSYRDMNDRYITWRQRLGSGPVRPSDPARAAP